MLSIDSLCCDWPMLLCKVRTEILGHEELLTGQVDQVWKMMLDARASALNQDEQVMLSLLELVSWFLHGFSELSDSLSL